MSSTQFIRHSISTANSNRIKPTTRTAKHDILFIQSYVRQAYSLELPFINNCVCFDRSRSHAHAFQSVDHICFRFPGKRSGRCLLSCAQNWELRKRSDWRISGLVAPLRVVFESRLANPATPLSSCRQREHDCLFDEGLTFGLQRVLTTVVQSLTAVAGNSVFLQHSIGGAT